MVIVIVIHHYSVSSHVGRHVSVSASELMFILQVESSLQFNTFPVQCIYGVRRMGRL